MLYVCCGRQSVSMWVLLLLAGLLCDSSLGLQCNTPSEIEKCAAICAKHNSVFIQGTPSSRPTCSCAPGFEPNHDKTSCVDIDECERGVDICPVGVSACINTFGAYKCICHEELGWVTSLEDATKCENLNECATGNNLCGPERCCRDLPPPPLTAPASARGYACAPYVASATGDRVCPTGFGPSASMTGNVATRPPIGVEFLNGEAILNLFEEARRGLIPILESPLTPALATVFAARAVNSPRRSQTLEGEEVSAQDRKQKRLEMAVKREELTAQKREAELRGALLQASKNFVKTQGKEQAAAKIVKSFTDHTSKALENEDYISAFESDEEESQVSSHKEEKKLASAERKARKEQEREALVEAKAAKREEKHLRQQQLQQRNAAKKDVYKPQRAKETREKESKKKPDFHISGSAIGGGQDLNQIDESVLNFIRVANQGKELQPRWITSDADEDDELVGEDHGARSGAGNVFVFDDLLYSQD